MRFNLFNKKADTKIETKSATTDEIRADILASESSINVNSKTSLKCVPYRSAINLITESVSVLPLNFYTKSGDEVRKPVMDHQIAKVLNKPNDLQTTQDFLKTILFNLMHSNEAFIKVVRSGRRVIELIPLSTDVVTYTINDNFTIDYKINGVDVDNKNILRIKGISENGLEVESRWKQAEKAISLYLNIEQYGDEFFTGGAKAAGFFSTEELLKEDVFKRVARGIASAISKSHSIPLLEGGIKYNRIDSTLKESQLSELKKDQVIEIARIFNLPTHLLQDYSGTSYASVEMLGIEFLTLTLLPIIKNIEQVINTFLIDDPKVFCEFEINAFLRADTKSRNEAYKNQVYSGILSVNEVRRLENRDPIENGDYHFYPLNNGVVEHIGTDNQPEAIAPINNIDQAESE